MDILKMTSAEEEMTEKTGPSTQDEEELVKKEDNSMEKDGKEEEGLLEKEVQGGGEDDEDGVNQVAKEDNAIETNDEELLEKQEEGGEHVEEVEQEVNEKGEKRLSEEKAESPKIISGGSDNAETKPVPSKKQIAKAKKAEAATNINNEVVKMRTEVKRVRGLLIRKLLRHLADLKKKKGNETDLEKNKRRVDRLLEEIRQMKRLRPDQVTKKALQSEFNFEKVCKDITSTMAQRALARIATHPQFSKKIDVIKAAVKAFEMERKKEQQKKKMTPFQEEEEQNALKQKEQETDDEEETEDEEADDGDENETIGELSETGTETAAPVNVTTETSDQIRSESLPRSKTVAFTKSVKTASTKNTDIKVILKETLQGKPTATKAPEQKQNLKPAPKMQQSKKDKEEDEEDVEEKRSKDDKEDKGGDEEEDESDLESSVEEEKEKEYFDDSTEERFREQSEGSGESEDDFFVGKVSKFKKKKKKAHATPDQKSQTSDEGQTDKAQSELNYKAPKLGSVFCSLSSSKPSRGGLSRDRGRGQGGDRSRGRGRGGHRGGGPDRFSRGPTFQKQDGGAGGKPEFKKSERGSVAKQFQSEDKDRTFAGRGTGRGRGDVSRPQDRRGPGASSHQAPQQALHPSWEASKKRKEQQGQIMAFQGKKIKFDD